MKYNTLGDRLIAKAKEFDPTYQPDRHNDLDEAVAILLDNMGGGEGGGTKLYKHTINTESGTPIIVISTDSRPFPIMFDELVQEYGFGWDNGRPYYSSLIGGYYTDPATILKMTYDGAPIDAGANLIGPMVCVPQFSGNPIRLTLSSTDVVTEL